MHASFEVPKAHNWVKGVDNDYTPPLAHPSLGKYRFMLPPNLRFGSQDCQLAQQCKTLAYVRALQYWMERAQPLIPSEPDYLMESVVELWQAMEPLVSFMEEKVFVAAAPSNWVEVSSPRPAELTPQDPQHSHSCSRNCWAHPRGSLLAAHGLE